MPEQHPSLNGIGCRQHTYHDTPGVSLICSLQVLLRVGLWSQGRTGFLMAACARNFFVLYLG